MSSFPLLAMFVALSAFCGLILHLRWDRIGAARMGALPLEDAAGAPIETPEAALEGTRER